MLQPSFADFRRLARTGDLVPVWRDLLFDADTAVTAYAKLTQSKTLQPDRPHRFGFLLESVVGGEKWARYTFLGAAPRMAWRLQHGGMTSRWSPEKGWSQAVRHDDPLAELDALLREARPVVPPGLPRFIGGAVGYLGYDVVRYVERLPAAPPDPVHLPEALFLFTDAILAIDNLFARAHAIAMVDVRDEPSDAELRQRYEAGVARADALVAALTENQAPAPLSLASSSEDPPFASSFSRDGYEAGVRRIKEYIAAGDAFQVVLSQRLTLPLECRPFDLYRALRSLNPSPYLYFLELDDLALVGSSPEVLVRLEDERVTLRPIAGTRARGRTDEEDAALAAELRADAKERAEHLMLVDLGRNDVGRIARFGSVRVSEFMGVERYSHVLHLVSQVEGELRAGLSAMDVLRACFPAGTVSGAPKIRAMEIIDELEPVGRGVYAGAVGYFSYGGWSMDMAIAIRTIVAAGGQAHVQAGAGIVADSDPASEYQETLSKARALLRVLATTPRKVGYGSLQGQAGH